LKNRNVILSLILILMLGILIVMALNVQPQASSVTTVKASFKPVTGAHVAVLRIDGAYEDYGWNGNLFTNAGKEYLEQSFGVGLSYGNFTYIGLCNSTGGCVISAGNATMDNEHVSWGMARAAGQYANLGTGN
jgi:hypothetical protein